MMAPAARAHATATGDSGSAAMTLQARGGAVSPFRILDDASGSARTDPQVFVKWRTSTVVRVTKARF